MATLKQVLLVTGLLSSAMLSLLTTAAEVAPSADPATTPAQESAVATDSGRRPNIQNNRESSKPVSGETLAPNPQDPPKVEGEAVLKTKTKSNQSND